MGPSISSAFRRRQVVPARAHAQIRYFSGPSPVLLGKFPPQGSSCEHSDISARICVCCRRKIYLPIAASLPPRLPHLFFVDYAAEAMDMKKHQMVILMKGHPGVGKSSIAICMAQLLQAPLIDKDDARDSFSSLRHTGPVGACRVTGFLLIQAGACS